MAITRSQLPGPKGLPVIGKALHIDVNDLHNQLAAWADEYGSIYKVRLGTHTLTIVTDPELIHGIYKNRPYTFARMRKVPALNPQCWDELLRAHKPSTIAWFIFMVVLKLVVNLIFLLGKSYRFNWGMYLPRSKSLFVLPFILQ